MFATLWSKRGTSVGAGGIGGGGFGSGLMGGDGGGASVGGSVDGGSTGYRGGFGATDPIPLQLVKGGAAGGSGPVVYRNSRRRAHGQGGHGGQGGDDDDSRGALSSLSGSLSYSFSGRKLRGSGEPSSGLGGVKTAVLDSDSISISNSDSEEHSRDSNDSGDDSAASEGSSGYRYGKAKRQQEQEQGQRIGSSTGTGKQLHRTSPEKRKQQPDWRSSSKRARREGGVNGSVSSDESVSISRVSSERSAKQRGAVMTSDGRLRLPSSQLPFMGQRKTVKGPVSGGGIQALAGDDAARNSDL